MKIQKDNAAWSIVEGDIITSWGREVNVDKVLPEYPRPQGVRKQWFNLNGLWEYAVTPKGNAEPDKYQGAILVPFPIESALSGVKRALLPEENLWYRRAFTIPENWKGKRILLNFGAVDWKAEVFINDSPAGSHTGGYYPFTFDITDYLKEGENTLVVKVWDPTDAYGQERGKQVLKPKGIYYTPVSGIWQTVWLEPVEEAYIERIKLTPFIDKEVLELETFINYGGKERLKDDSLGEADFRIKVEVLSPELFIDKEIAWEGRRLGDYEGELNKAFEISIPKAMLWTPDTPYLYPIIITLYKGAEPLDQLKSYFAMRSFGTSRDENNILRFTLNNKPIFHNGVLDQGYWPDGLYTAPSDEALLYDIKLTKELGFNTSRKHIKVEPLRWYYHCDRIGLIVWQDMINGGCSMKLIKHGILTNFFGMTSRCDNNYKAAERDSRKNRENYKKELKEMIDALYNVPSIALWVPFNEDWGQFDAKETAIWVKNYDPTRIVDHASGWMDQGGGEVKSLHIYFKKLSLPKKKDNRVMAITEYGGYTLFEEGHVWRRDKEFGYKSYKSREALQEAYISLIGKQLKPLIPQGLSGAIYTQLTDVETEINGFVTYDREVLKVNKDEVKKVNDIRIQSSHTVI